MKTLKTLTKEIPAYFNQFADKKGNTPCFMKVAFLFEDYTKAYIKERKPQ